MLIDESSFSFLCDIIQRASTSTYSNLLVLPCIMAIQNTNYILSFLSKRVLW